MKGYPRKKAPSYSIYLGRRYIGMMFFYDGAGSYEPTLFLNMDERLGDGEFYFRDAKTLTDILPQITKKMSLFIKEVYDEKHVT